MEDYHGISLIVEEVNFLKEMEGILGEKIPQEVVNDFGIRSKQGHITFLALNNKLLKTIPSTINALKKIRDLQLSNNLLSNLPDSLSGLQFVERLHINHNRLEVLPNAFSQLSSLRFLYVENNKLRNLPTDIGNLPSLEILNLDGNLLNILPNSLSTITKLRILRLNNNQIKKLPPNFGDLSNLKVLTLRGNNLLALPSSFTKLEKLNVLDLRENPNFSIPSSIEQHLSNLEQGGCVILGAKYSSPFKNRTYTIQGEPIKNDQDLVAEMENEYRLHPSGRFEGKVEYIEDYIEIYSPMEDYLNFGLSRDGIILEYISNNSTSFLGGEVSLATAIEVALEYIHTGRLSLKINWKV